MGNNSGKSKKVKKERKIQVNVTDAGTKMFERLKKLKTPSKKKPTTPKKEEK